MKPLLILPFLLISFYSFSQDWEFEAPNYKKIEKNIQKKGSNLFYSNLMDRFKKADSTMTLEEKRHLYYGYTFDEKYSPYSHSNYNDSLKVVLQLDNHSANDLKEILRFGDSLLSANPFDLRAMDYQLYALEKSEDKKGFDNKMTQLTTVFDALASSGLGTTKKEAFYVISTSHEYDMLSILGFTFGGTQSLIEHYDYLTVEKNDAGIEGFYFDVTPCLNSMSGMFKD